MLVRVAFLASIAGFLFGYDLGLIGGAMHGIKETFQIRGDAAVEAVVGAAKLGASVRRLSFWMVVGVALLAWICRWSVC
jgi:hypothetical protein